MFCDRVVNEPHTHDGVGVFDRVFPLRHIECPKGLHNTKGQLIESDAPIISDTLFGVHAWIPLEGTRCHRKVSVGGKVLCKCERCSAQNGNMSVDRESALFIHTKRFSGTLLKGWLQCSRGSNDGWWETTIMCIDRSRSGHNYGPYGTAHSVRTQNSH